MEGENYRAIQSTYRKLMLTGLLLLLVAFGLLIVRPFGNASLILGAVLFPVAMIPLELARRTAMRLAMESLRTSE